LTLEAAKEILKKFWRIRQSVEEVSLEEAGGRILAEEIASNMDVPPFDRAAVDGYAVRAADTFGADEAAPRKLTFVATICAGDKRRSKLGKGQCAEIATGSPVPAGADAVVRVEHAVQREDTVEVGRAVSPGENVFKRGSEIKKGSKIFPAGSELSPFAVGTLAAVGTKKVKVYRRPKIAVISSGAELVKAGRKLGYGQVYDINGPTLCEVVKACGGEPSYLGIALDDAPRIKALVRRGLASCDVVVISGGSSAGAGDIVPSVVDSLGKPGVVVHGLAMKPGKPTFVAVVRGKPVFGLPGYPGSALMVFDQLVAPYIRRMAGMRPLAKLVMRAKLSRKILSARGRRELVLVRLARKGGELLAEPLLKGSGAITALSMANGYVEVPLEQEIVDEGETVDVVILR
jgi:molybdenum cofactor synthesis domain-containing protein